ncbi:tetratricopeptide repeat protein 37 [Fopius arisanus]|uniref:TTC37_0 protein n=1 Tax=Fopius arisanus TaxID=64838 RepID=A0A0C9QMZ3_9HYME|nr:PREDICTED: tetratricopeptide repeat protein 37 [Fopius arisanus]XP_011301229.1 PREDICTED: tetratricopeptide repeat protein 37 [Fopius arisanus]
MSKESKTALKEVKTLIKEGQHSEALKICQKLLRQDKTNYQALLGLARAMWGLDEYQSQVPLALKRAIELQPDNPLAHQGLVAYYEKQPERRETWSELLPTYCKLLQVDRTSPKLLAYISKVSHLVVALSDQALTTQSIAALCLLRAEGNEKKIVDESLATIFLKFPELSQDHPEAFLSSMASVTENESFPHHHECCKNYLKSLFAAKKFDCLLSVAAKMHHTYPRDLTPLEWICRVYTEQKIMVGLDFCRDLQIDFFYNDLLQMKENSYMAIFAKGMHLWQEGNLTEARDFLNHAVSLQCKQFYAWIALAEVNANLYCWEDAEGAILEASKYLKNQNEALQTKADMIFVEAVVKGGNKSKCPDAVEICRKLMKTGSSNRVTMLVARAEALLGISPSSTILEELERDPETRRDATILKAKILRDEGRLEEAADVLGSVLETAETWFMLGEINWALRNFSHALMALLKGVHVDPNHWQCLLYLGHYYRERTGDLEKARKCYQKALRINPNSIEAGARLSTAYRLLKNSEANMQMLQRVTTADGGGPKWAWLQLGLQQLDEGKIVQAIKSLRYVIRADPNDNHCWESLADAYWARGAHTSALKSYQRALELSPGSLYPMLQIANINLVLGRHLEAKKAFLEVLSQERRYIPALKGLAETYLGLARENSRAQLLGRSSENIQQAADCLTDAIVEKPSLSCLWKLLGDACYRAATFPQKYCTLNVAGGLVQNPTERRVTLKKTELLSLSSRCFCRALSLSKDSSFLWHDLACCYLTQLRLDSSVDLLSTAKKSLAAAQQAVKLNPSTWVHWNLLGVICMTEEIKNYALAQHCWVMAIDREPNNAIAWTNLGTLYLHLGDPFKANEAFSRAQRADPEYENSWIGQGLIAESVQRKEAMDLFRHATQLAYHPQAAVGYAHWVLTTLLDPNAKKDPLYNYTIENMHAIAMAIDAMTWCVERVPDSAFSRNALGLLLERQKLLRPAAEQFSKALKLSHDHKEHQDKIRVNYTRILVQLGEYEKAVEICQGIKTPSFKSHCQLALSLFKAARYEESYDAYGTALQQLADPGSDEAHVLCAMASMAYMFQGVDQVKTLLYQCIQIQPPIVAGLLASAALGLLHEDYNLTTLVLKELQAYNDHPEYRHHVAILTAYSCLSNDDVKGAVRIISKAVHRHPEDVGSWVGLVRILLETNYAHFGNCAQKTLFLGRKTSTVAVAQVACISSLGQLATNLGREGLRAVQKTVHSFPGSVESWANLVGALSSRCKEDNSTPNATWLAALILKIRRQLKSSSVMDEWFTNNYNKLSKTAAVH